LALAPARNPFLLTAAVVASLVASASPASGTANQPASAKRQVRIVMIHYRAHDGVSREAYVLLPAWYGPGNDPPIPLIISPHGRGVSALANTLLWGALPARGPFAVLSPDGEGRRLARYSWGAAGQIEDLARMPVIAHRALPWVHIDQHRIYAFGGSMGGQETLLLLARHPRLLAGAVAFDAVTNMTLRYRNFLRIPCNWRCLRTWNGPIGRALQSLARQEVGGTPVTRPLAYAWRSPATFVRTIAVSCVPLQLWWSVKDRVVVDQRLQSGALFQRIRKLSPGAPVTAFVGAWRHSAEMHAKARLPIALAALGLLSNQPPPRISGLHVFAPTDPPGCSRT
jgi:pimeloyl-ACP methyl ester carboxylesterase